MYSTKLVLRQESTLLPRMPTVRQVILNLMLLMTCTKLVVRACLQVVVMIFQARTSTKTEVVLKLMLLSKVHCKKHWWSVETRYSFRSVAKSNSLQEKV